MKFNGNFTGKSLNLRPGSMTLKLSVFSLNRLTSRGFNSSVFDLIQKRSERDK